MNCSIVDGDNEKLRSVCFEEIDTCVINVFVESAEFRQPLHNTTTSTI